MNPKLLIVFLDSEGNAEKMAKGWEETLIYLHNRQVDSVWKIQMSFSSKATQQMAIYE